MSLVGMGFSWFIFGFEAGLGKVDEIVTGIAEISRPGFFLRYNQAIFFCVYSREWL
jgi:hypothetical protein